MEFLRKLLRHSIIFFLNVCLVTICIPLDLPAQVNEGEILAILPEDVFSGLKPIQHKAFTLAPSVVSSRLDLAVSEANATVAAAGMKPRASGYFNYNVQREKRLDLPAPTTSDKFYYNFSVTQPVFHWGALEAAKAIGSVQVDIAKGDFETATKQLVAQARAQYLNLVIQKMTVRSAAFRLKQAKENYEAQKVKVEHKEAPEGTLSSAQIAIDQAQLQWDRDNSDFDFALRFFRKLTGIEDLAAEQIPDAFPLIDVTKAKAAAAIPAAPGHPVDDADLENADRRIAVEKENLKIQNVRLRPTIDLVAGYTQDQLSYTANIGQKVGTKTSYIGVQVNWNIFDGFATKGLKAASRTRIRSLTLQRDQLSEQLTIQAEQLHQQVLFAAEALRLSNIQRQGVDGGIGYTESQKKLGLASERDVANATGAAYDQQVATARVAANFLNLVGQYLSLIGEDPIVNDLYKSSK